METPENLEEKGGHQQEINTADDIMTKLHTLQVTQFEGFIPTHSLPCYTNMLLQKR